MILGAALLAVLVLAVGVVAWRVRQHRRTVAELDKALRERLAASSASDGCDPGMQQGG